MAPDDGRRQKLRVLVADERGRSLRAGALGAWLRRVAPAAARGTVSIALVGEARIRALNRTYRHQDYATDVLSFPSDSADARVSAARAPSLKRRRTSVVVSAVARSASARPRRTSTSGVEREGGRRGAAERFLGDIVIARRVAQRQAREAGHSVAAELRVLALHGLLHLLGYDHERDNGTMRRFEARLRRKGGLTEGLIERGRP
jgi:rRNA maturation RNase YbeY